MCASAPFFVQQSAFPVYAPLVPGGLAILTHHSVAGDDDRHAVGRTGAGDGARRARLSDRRGHLTVRPALARGNLLKGLPHSLLKGGSTHVQRDLATTRVSRISNTIENRVDPTMMIFVAPLDRRVREIRFERTRHLSVRGAELHGADAALSGRHEHVPNR